MGRLQQSMQRGWKGWLCREQYHPSQEKSPEVQLPQPPHKPDDVAPSGHKNCWGEQSSSDPKGDSDLGRLHSGPHELGRAALLEEGSGAPGGGLCLRRREEMSSAPVTPCGLTLDS